MGGHRYVGQPARRPQGARGRVARLVRAEPAQIAWRRMVLRSLVLKATGLPCMLLDLMALAATSSAWCGRIPNAARPGIASMVIVSRIQATPSAMDAAGFPVSNWATSAYRSRAG